MVNDRNNISKNAKERRKGRDSGRAAAKFGYRRTIFRENDDRSIIYQNAYNKAYDKVASSSPGEKTRRQAEEAGKQRAWRGRPKKDFTGEHKTPEYIESYIKGYERIASLPKNQQKLKDRIDGLDAGKQAALKGEIQGDLSDKSLEYQEGYNKGYKKFLAQDEERRKGKASGRIAASKNRPRPDFEKKFATATPAYQKAHLQAYDNYVLNKKRKESYQAYCELFYRVSNAIPFLEDVPETEESAPLQLPSGTDGMEGYEEKFHSEFFNPQQIVFPSPCFPSRECSIGYSEGLNPPQEPGTLINSVEELGHYLDSLSSPTGNAPIPNPSPPQAKETSLNLDAADDVPGVYETNQPAQRKSRLYPPLFFSTPVPVLQPEPAHEALIHYMADQVNKKI